MGIRFTSKYTLHAEGGDVTTSHASLIAVIHENQDINKRLRDICNDLAKLTGKTIEITIEEES